MSRKTARRYAFELIYQLPFHSEFDAGAALDLYPEDNLPKISKSERSFVLETIMGVSRYLDVIDNRISANTKGWSISRINRIDLAVLRLAIYEICYTDTPIGISINEAVELAKLYSGEESGGFVNAVCTKVSKHPKVRHA